MSSFVPPPNSLPPEYRVLPWAFAVAPLAFGAAIWYFRATRDSSNPLADPTSPNGTLFSVLCLAVILVHAYRGPILARSILSPSDGKPHWFIRFIEFHQSHVLRADGELPTHVMSLILGIALAPLAFHFAFTMIGKATLENHIILSVAFWLVLWRLSARVTAEIRKSNA